MSKIINEVALDFDDVLIVPQLSDIKSRKEVDLNVTYTTLHSKRKISGIPIISANMSTVSTFSMAKALASMDLFCALHKHHDINNLVKFYHSNKDICKTKIFYTLGINDTYKFKEFIDKFGEVPSLICCDAANGYMKSFHKFIEDIRLKTPTSIIMAGNVVTADGAAALLESGADIVKLGIGSSSVCRTRTVAATGLPQFSAIMNTIETVKSMNGLLCSDGGCNVEGDFSKAFGAGADFVMSGTMFAGHDECEGELINGKMRFYGMASSTAVNKFNNGLQDYRSSEGIATFVDYQGPVEFTVKRILGGIRSAASYSNCKTLSEFYKKIQFARVNRTYNNRWDNNAAR